jgi:type IV pilus assembly protein PilB
MGIESYLLADSMVGIIAQRLVRRLCPNCKKPHLATDEEKEIMHIDDDGEITIYEAVGCDKCDNTGYVGRIGIYEIMTVTQTIRDLINRHATAIEIQKAAQAEGMHTLRESAAKLVLEGTTSYRELLHTTFQN